MMKYIKKYYYKVMRLINYLPQIWKGEDYDYRFAIDLFKYQLERTANFLDSDKAYSLEGPVDAMRIRTATELLTKVYDEDYTTAYVDKMTKMYGVDVLDLEFIETSNGTYTLEYKYETEGWYNRKEISLTLARLVTESAEKQKKAEKLVWNFIAHNIRRWWD